MSAALSPSALDFATRCHATQRRDSDDAPFIEHPIEVARLLRDAGCSDELVAAGLLHDVVEDTGVSIAELTRRFGCDVAQIVGAVSEDESIAGYRPRKRALREQVRAAGRDAALVFAADKISKVRELRDRVERRTPSWGGHDELDPDELLRLEHYERSLTMLRAVAPRHALVIALASELGSLPRDPVVPAGRAMSPVA